LALLEEFFGAGAAKAAHTGGLRPHTVKIKDLNRPLPIGRSLAIKMLPGKQQACLRKYLYNLYQRISGAPG